MKAIILKNQRAIIKSLLVCAVSIFVYGNIDAQQKPAKPGGGASKKSSTVNKPSNNVNKPSTVNKPSNNVSKPSTVNKPSNNVSKQGSVSKPSNSVGNRNTNVSNSGNKTNNIGSNNNKVNIDNSKKNVNVNVDNSKNYKVNNSRNTSVRRSNNYRPYGRPPYVYGGRRYRCYHPYYFHPYRPFVWGPRWHPWGYFISTLATTAIILSIVENEMPADIDLAANFISGNGSYSLEDQPVLSGPHFSINPGNQGYKNEYTENAVLNFKDEYWYDEGTYYLKADGGYIVVSAPVGAKIKTLPSGYETVSLDDGTKNYYYGGTFYEKSSSGYTVVAPTAGTVVEHISEGGEEVKMGDITYVKMGETYFQPIQKDGKDMYEVADVEDDK